MAGRERHGQTVRVEFTEAQLRILHETLAIVQNTSAPHEGVAE